MKKRIMKIATISTAAVALVVVTVLVTVALLTSSSAVSNTFTVGNVGIEMFESKVNADGQKKDENGNLVDNQQNIYGENKNSDGNSYHLIPGKTYDKDPTIYITEKSDKSYLFVKVINGISSIEHGNYVPTAGTTPAETDPTKPTIEEQMIAKGWQKLLEKPTGIVYVYTGPGTGTDGAYTDEDITAIKNQSRAAYQVLSNVTKKVDIFETFSIHKDAKVDLYGGAKVTLTGFAIQTEGFADDPVGTINGKTAAMKAWLAIEETYPYESGTAISE